MLVCRPQAVTAQDSIPQLVVSSDPSPLVEGTVSWLVVRPHSGTVTGGEAAGEPMHFEQSDEGEYRTVIAVPVETADSLRVALFVAQDDRTDTILSAVPVTQAGYPRETITVAPALAKPNRAAAARIERENARSREVSRASRTRARLWEGPFQLPRNSRITSRFGAARVYNGEVRTRHTGTDFAGAVGAPVRAAGRGLVAMVADFYLAGRALYIDHGAGMITAYFHLSRSDVVQGDTVVAGQIIGRVGQSGRVTGPHLHWTLRANGARVDPLSLVAVLGQ